jgi:hypothetical protein
MNISREVIRLGSFGLSESRITNKNDDPTPSTIFIPHSIRAPLLADYAISLRGDEASDLSCSGVSSAFGPSGSDARNTYLNPAILNGE